MPLNRIERCTSSRIVIDPYELANPALPDYFVLRAARDVIRMGAFRIWDKPKEQCVVRNVFFRRCGISEISNDAE